MMGLRGWVWIASVVIAAAAMASAGTPGSFRGKIIESPNAAAEKNWVYVQGRNGMVRRVEVSHARVEYDDSVPAASRARDPHDALQPGAEVRVTAEQGSDGEWHASRVEILSAGAGARVTESGRSQSRSQ
jgi:hypothetical protein